MKARDCISKGIMHLMRSSPFYSTIIVKQKIIEDPKLDAPMATNGESLKYNPDHIVKLNNKETYEILKHEAMHIANKHHIRMKTILPKYEKKAKELNIDLHRAWNVAADLAINSLLVHVDHESIWRSSDVLKHGCIPTESPFTDYEKLKSAEYYMHKVMDDVENSEDREHKKEQLGLNGRDKEISGIIEEAESSEQEAEAKTNAMIAAASVMAKGAGSNPSNSVKQLIDEYLGEAKVNWRSEIDRFILVSTKGKPNYRKPSRRFESNDFIHPSKKNKTVNKIVILLDVSGSMDDKAVASVYEHMTSIVKHHEKIQIELVPFDDEVFEEEITYFNKSNLPVKDTDRKRVGYGGTKYVPAAQYALNKQDVNGIIMVTDLMPFDESEFHSTKIHKPFLMLYVADEWHRSSNDDYYERKFSNRRVVRVDI